MATEPANTLTTGKVNTIPEQIVATRRALVEETQPLLSRAGPLSEPITNGDEYKYDVESIRSVGMNTAYAEGIKYPEENALVAGLMSNHIEINLGTAAITLKKMKVYDAAGQDSLRLLLNKRMRQLMAGQEYAVTSNRVNVPPVSTASTSTAGKVYGFDSCAGNGYLASGWKALPYISTGDLENANRYGGGRDWSGTTTVNSEVKVGAQRSLSNEIVLDVTKALSRLENFPNAIWCSRVQHSNFARIRGNADQVVSVQNLAEGNGVKDTVDWYENSHTGGKIPIYSSPNFQTYKSRTGVTNKPSVDCTTAYFVNEDLIEMGYLEDWEEDTDLFRDGDSVKGAVRASWTWANINPEGHGYIRDLAETHIALSS